MNSIIYDDIKLNLNINYIDFYNFNHNFNNCDDFKDIFIYNIILQINNIFLKYNNDILKKDIINKFINIINIEYKYTYNYKYLIDKLIFSLI
jgi:hypothetical protein